MAFNKQARPAAKALRPFFRSELQADGTLELVVYEDIGYDWWSGAGITAKSVKEQLDGARGASRIAVRINSPGGDAFEGIAIYNLLRDQKKPITVHVDGIAASAASIIAMAGDEIVMGTSSMMMIHRAWTSCVGFEEDMRSTADLLAKVSQSIAQTYVARTGKDVAEILELMKAETWMGAEDCIAEGFATAITGDSEVEEKALALARRFRLLSRMKALPDSLRLDEEAKPCECPCESCDMGNCLTCSNEDCEDETCLDCPMQK